MDSLSNVVNVFVLLVRYRDLSWNELTGPIPSSNLSKDVTTMYALQLLILFPCFLTGDLQFCLHVYHTALSFLLVNYSNLSNNILNGSIPQSFSDLPLLQML